MPGDAGTWRGGVLPLVRESVGGAAAGGLLLPLVLAGAPVHASVLITVLALALACAAALLTWRYAGRSPATLVVATAGVVAAAFLMHSASYPGSGFVVAALLGLSTGPLVPRRFERAPYTAAGAGFGAAIVVVLWGGAGAGGACLGVAVLAIVAGGWGLLNPEPGKRGRLLSESVAAGVAAYGLFAVFWVGSTAPTVTWFGSLTSHGPRSGNEVAITFDDGPNPPFTLEIAGILEAHGARGTFFEVGKAVVQQPDVTRALIDRGHMVGNHSYYHGAVSYLDPSYPELEQTQKAFKDAVGVCPSVFRPPHGTHTPFMSHIVDDHGMTLVTWDDSAMDWVETDPDVVAAGILSKVQPGSIILLHDGSDGNIGADRSVILQALPKILDGLKAKGLTPVTLDKLLGIPKQLSNC